VLQALKPSKWLVEAVVLIVLVLISLSAVSGWRSADRANVFPEALSTIPTVKPNTGFTTLAELSLMRSQPGQRMINVHVDYVPAKTKSIGPFVVSVHPIDSSTWAGVALGSDGRCYGMLVSELNPDYETYYARFPMHTPCRGDVANRTTVRSTEYPS
jgi:hypothetical protein